MVNILNWIGNCKQKLVWFFGKVLVNTFIVTCVLILIFIFNLIYSLFATSADITNVSLVTILVIFSIYNISLTMENIEETKNERKIVFIGNRLVHFYYPLQNFLNICVQHLNDSREVLFNPSTIDIRNISLNADYKDFITHKHLAKKDTATYLEDFLKTLLEKIVLREDNDIERYTKLNEAISVDINSFKKELDELIK